jgi:reductive dehalogenase
LKPDIAKYGADAYVTGETQRFDQKNEMFSRTVWDLPELGKKLWKPEEPRATIAGRTRRDFALQNSAWYIPVQFTGGNTVGNHGLYAWNTKLWGVYGKPKQDMALEADPGKLSATVKQVARMLGASLVGICKLDRRWLYSNEYNLRTNECSPINVSEEFRYAIVLAYEMDYQVMQLSPAITHGFTIGMGYTKMAMVASALAQFIRLMGYQALPMGNDTANSIPLAIDAGLGELGRMGLLITPEYGPRVRLNKVLTNMPLIPDHPKAFGVWEFCLECQKCARECPGMAIQQGAPSEQIYSQSNRSGIHRWALDAEKCLSWFAQNGSDCSNCIRVCPFNKPPHRWHSMVRWLINRFPPANRLIRHADDLFGYGKRASAADFWD